MGAAQEQECLVENSYICLHTVERGVDDVQKGTAAPAYFLGEAHRSSDMDKNFFEGNKGWDFYTSVAFVMIVTPCGTLCA